MRERSDEVEAALLRRDLAALRLDLAMVRLRCKYSPDQPRVPGGPGGGQWIDAGGEEGEEAVIKPARYGQRRTRGRPTLPLGGMPQIIEQGLLWLRELSGQNGPDSQAIAEFRAREYPTDKAAPFDLTGVRTLSRDEVDAFCPRLEEVQARTDRAAERVRQEQPGLSAQQYGTAVHLDLERQIKALKDQNFVAERSIVAGNYATYGVLGSVRVDILERVDASTVCAYDIKTGQAALSFARSREIGEAVLTKFGPTERIVVTEIKPGDRR